MPAAVFLQTETLNNRFSAKTLDAAKRFLRMSSSTLRGARKYAASQKYPLPPKRPTALTATQRRDIDVANKRLKAMRARGEMVPELYDVPTFTKATAALAAEFIKQKWSTKRKKRAPILRSFPAALGRYVLNLVDAYQWSKTKDAYYRARDVHEIPDDTSLEEFAEAEASDKPGITGDQLIEWVKEGGDIEPPPGSKYRVTVSRKTYDNLLAMTGGKERKFLEYMHDFYTGDITDLPDEFLERMGLK